MAEPAELDLVPARMINEHVYCPRLAFIEWMEGEFEDNAFTAEGRHAHRRVDREGGRLPGPAEETEKIHARSVYLSAPIAGIVARIDLVEAQGKRATPVDYKRGAPPDVKFFCHEPERVQLCAQAIVLEENGFEVLEAIVYFVGAKQRVIIELSAELRARTLAAVGDLRAMAASATLPPVLVGSPKCFGCSLVGVCLPDEVAILSRRSGDDPRRLFPARDDALPVHVQAQGGTVGVKGETLYIAPREGERKEVRLRDVSQLCLYGNVQVTTQALRSLCEHEVATCFFSFGGWFYAMVHGLSERNALLRRAQHAASASADRSLALARSLVEQKIRNQRTMLRRNHDSAPIQALSLMKHLARTARSASSLDELLGIEGSAARVYFRHFPGMLRAGVEIDLAGRNRRPPRDPVNALLSLAYALLAKDLAITVSAIGFDAYCGFLHQPRHGRPSLALDLMEPFRPILADSVVLTAFNTGVIRPHDFVRRVGAVSLTDAGRRRFIQSYERRMDELVTHPTFGYRISYRRILEVQARLLARHLVGELTSCPTFLTR
jgi:CRISPR-associated endonuclease Cas1/CRISPR-associated protein Cas4